MAATSTSPRPQRNPATLKFTAVKVDVSALTKSCRCKAFVISSQTTSHDLTEMVLHKLKIDVTGHVNGTCLLGASCDGGEKRVLSKDEKILSLLGNKNKRTLTLELVPFEAINGNIQPSPHPETDNQNEVDLIKAGNLSDSARNGMTLPGYKKTDVNYNIGSGFVTSTPNPDSSDSMRSTADSGFLIHYEPYSDNPDSQRHTRQRSRSFELARDNGYKLDISSGNASDSGMVVNGANNGQSQKDPEVHQDYPHQPSPKDGFQILQSQNSAWTPFSRHVSDGFIKSLSHQALPITASVPDVSQKPSGSNLSRRRSLPKITLSQEQMEEKKKSVTDLFASKLKLYIEKAKVRKNNWAAEPRYQRRSINRDDDTMSVTSMEVADIMSSASPMKPYEESDESESEDSQSEVGNTSTTPQNVFQPLNEPPLSPEYVTNRQNLINRDERNGEPDGKPSLGEFVEQSLQNFMVGDENYNHRKLEYEEGHGSPHKHKNSKTVQHFTDRGVPLFTLLTTHLLAPVMVRCNREMAPNKPIGVRLCDVTYAKCVRHVIRHWATQSRQFSVDSQLSERMLVAIGGIDRRSTVILAGKLFRGDIIVEVNGESTLELSARDVISRIIPKELVSLVVARSRLNVERAQSP